MDDENCLVHEEDSIINEHLIDEKLSNHEWKNLAEKIQQRSDEDLVRTSMKLLKEIWIGDEIKIVKVKCFVL